jgi:hypothetical protein
MEFQYVDEYSKDQGANIRQKAQDITDLLLDEARLREERRLWAYMRDRTSFATNTEEPEPAPFPQLDPNSPKPSPSPTKLDPPSALTHTNMTIESEYSKYSGGMGLSPSQQVAGASNHSHLTSYSQPHHDRTPNALTSLTFPDRDDAHAVPSPLLPPPPQEGRGPTSDMEGRYDTPPDGGDDASQDSDSRERKFKSSFAPPRQGLAEPQPDSWVESRNLEPVDTATTSVSESGTPSAQHLSSCVEC